MGINTNKNHTREIKTPAVYRVNKMDAKTDTKKGLKGRDNNLPWWQQVVLDFNDTCGMQVYNRGTTSEKWKPIYLDIKCEEDLIANIKAGFLNLACPYLKGEVIEVFAEELAKHNIYCNPTSDVPERSYVLLTGHNHAVLTNPAKVRVTDYAFCEITDAQGEGDEIQVVADWYSRIYSKACLTLRAEGNAFVEIWADMGVGNGSAVEIRDSSTVSLLARKKVHQQVDVHDHGVLIQTFTNVYSWIDYEDPKSVSVVYHGRDCGKDSFVAKRIYLSGR